MNEYRNEFIGYINSLHNLGASGANALAESQALSPYFGELYEPFPLIDRLVEALIDDVPRVVVLTGHAGDGKSTVALDVLKKLKNISPKNPLEKPFNEREDVSVSGVTVTIIKDMSELSSECRQSWLKQAFSESGSWLIVSNTGPLLHSLEEYGQGAKQDIENEVLKLLDLPLGDTLLDSHSLSIFEKELMILNLSRFNNVQLGSKILMRLVEHPGWETCKGCPAELSCPLQLNRAALSDAKEVVEERVRWIYQYLSAYEQRLTLRQMVAQLAFGITGGMSCDEACKRVTDSSAEGKDQGINGLEDILFSEGFFGYRNGVPWPQSESLKAIALLRRSTYGAPVGVNFERKLSTDSGIGWGVLPPSLNSIESLWRKRSAESTGVRWRFALRRMTFLFGAAAQDKEQVAHIYLDSILKSPSLRQYDLWQNAGKITLSRSETKRMLTSCLRVLLEIFSGFSANQFDSQHDRLYLTLRRSDLAVIQPTQLVIETLSFREFDMGFDSVRRVPILQFDRGAAELDLTLPLLDFIRNRDAGELGNRLSPIHQAQLDWFREELLKVTSERRKYKDEIELLRAGVDGVVHLHRFLLDEEKNKLEQG